MKKENILFYSTNTYLSYLLCARFYNSQHFVWCSPVFNSEVLHDLDPRKKIPPSSNPYKIYLLLAADVKEGDLHSDKIKNNIIGLKKEAGIHYENKIINDNELALITKIIDTAQISDFRPLLYVIPTALVQGKIRTVSVDKIANPLSIEYQIIDLKSNEFEIIEF